MKNISFKIDEEFHKEIKLKGTEEVKVIKDFIIELMKDELEKN